MMAVPYKNGPCRQIERNLGRVLDIRWAWRIYIQTLQSEFQRRLVEMWQILLSVFQRREIQPPLFLHRSHKRLKKYQAVEYQALQAVFHRYGLRLFRMKYSLTLP